MTLVKRSNDLFPAFFDDFMAKNWFASAGINNTMPAVNIKEGKNNFEIELAVPGMDKSDFQIEVEDHYLTISYEKKKRAEDKPPNSEFTQREFSYESFHRSFTLPKTANLEKIKAEYTSGILRLDIDKDEKLISKGKSIKIS